MKELLIPIIIAIIGSNALFGFLQFLITRKDNSNKRFAEIEQQLIDMNKRIGYMEQGNIRLQLLFLINTQPHRSEEIIKLAKQYFVSFKGNYYLTGIFKQYLDDNKLIYPEWFIHYKDNV